MYIVLTLSPKIIILYELIAICHTHDLLHLLPSKQARPETSNSPKKLFCVLFSSCHIASSLLFAILMFVRFSPVLLAFSSSVVEDKLADIY